MDTLMIDDMQHGLPIVAHYVLENGTHAEPRGLKTREVLCPTIILANPYDCLSTHIGRGMSQPLASLESLSLIGGTSVPHLLTKIAPATHSFLNGGIFQGAYGPRLGAQMPRIVEALRKDPDTRQAVAVVWDPMHDLFLEHNVDRACTLSLQFFIRDDKLLLRTTMRSNDVWWGFTNDVVQFTQLQHAVADCLDIEVGYYIHQPGSLHVYERDIAAIEDMHAPTKGATQLEGLSNLGGISWQELEAIARLIVSGHIDEDNVVLSPTARWHIEQSKRWLDVD